MFDAVTTAVFERMRAEAPIRFCNYDPTPQDINRGWCHDWAYEVCLRIPHAEHVLYRTFENGHSFVRIGRRYYDAQHLDGVCSWRNLFRFLLRPIWEDLREADITILASRPASHVDHRGFRMFR